MTRPLIIFVCIALLASAAFPHGNEQHVIGTIAKISQDAVTVQTPDKTLVEVKIVSDTRFTKNNTVAGLKDLRVGDRVVIHAKRVGDQLQAHTVQIGIAKTPTQPH
jgi:hypothetical protein